MREILFRGKSKETGEWVYGSLQWFKGFSIFDSDWKNFFAVDGETVGQYTGLTDKNGTKIFEGDILEFSDRLVVVFWHSHLGCWDSNFLEYTNQENGKDDMSPLNWDYKSRVIGNIHDNPELLSR